MHTVSLHCSVLAACAERRSDLSRRANSLRCRIVTIFENATPGTRVRERGATDGTVEAGTDVEDEVGYVGPSAWGSAPGLPKGANQTAAASSTLPLRSRERAAEAEANWRGRIARPGARYRTLAYGAGTAEYSGVSKVVGFSEQ